MYQAIIITPILSLLIWLYNTVAFQDLGIAIILLTVCIRLILFPIFQKSAKYQVVMKTIQPKIQEIQKQYKGDQMKQTEEMMALYKSHNMNPFSGFFYLLIQIPILIGVYQIFLNDLNAKGLELIYSFITKPDPLHTSLLGLIDLSQRSILLVGIAAGLQYIQGVMNLPQKANNSTADRTARMMVYVGPILTIVIFGNLPAAVSLYWAITSLFSVVQQRYIEKSYSHDRLEQQNKGN